MLPPIFVIVKTEITIFVIYFEGRVYHAAYVTRKGSFRAYF